MIKKFLKIFTKSNINSPNRLQNLKNDPKIKKILIQLTTTQQKVKYFLLEDVLDKIYWVRR